MTTPYVEPRTEDEKIISTIWAKELDLEKVGIIDNFFELEGDSLKITQIAKRLQEEMGVSITIREVFDAPTVMALAEHIARLRSQTALGTARSHEAELAEGEI